MPGMTGVARKRKGRPHHFCISRTEGGDEKHPEGYSQVLIWIDPTPVVLWLSAHPVGRSPLLESYSGKSSLTARLFFGVVVLDNYRYNVLYFFYTLIGAGAKHLLPHALIVGFPDHL